MDDNELKKAKQNQDSQKTAHTAAKGAATYVAGPVGNKVYDAFSQTKLGQRLEEQAGKQLQRIPIAKPIMQRANDSGALDQINKGIDITTKTKNNSNRTLASSNLSMDSQQGNVDGNVPTGKKKKKWIIVIIIFLISIIIMISPIIIIASAVSALFADNSITSVMSCQTITVINTDCDSSGNNCTNKYDGEVDFDDYIAGIVAARDKNNANNFEYYKTLAIDSRTNFYSNPATDCEAEGNVNYQEYIDVEESPYSELIKKAVEDTQGLAVTKEGQVVGGVLSSDEDIRPLDSNTALNMITNQNYTANDVLQYYYGSDAEVTNINMPTGNAVAGFINPLNHASCTDSFGCRIHPISGDSDFHPAIDLGAASGEPIYATKAGKVTSVMKSVPGYSDVNSYGNYILIDHGDGTQTRYAHMLYGSIPTNINVGTNVTRGQIIGKVGATGSATGPHLHYEIYINGRHVNPYEYLDLSQIGNQGACNVYANTPLSVCGGN